MADLDPRIQKLLDNPSYREIEKSNPDRAKRLLAAARARLASMPTPTPAATPMATPPTAAATAEPPSIGDLRSQIEHNDPFQSVQNKILGYGEKGLGYVSDKYNDALSTVLGDTGGAVMSGTVPFPRTYPELAAQAAMMTPGFQELGAGKQILAGAAIPWATSLLTNSKMSPGVAAASGALGGVIGGAGNKLLDLKMAGAGSKSLIGQLSEDLSRTGTALAHGVPDVQPKVLEGPGQFLNYYAGRAVDRFGHIKSMAEGMLQRAKALAPQMKALKAQADAFRAKAVNTHPALKSYYLRQAADLDFQASAGDMAKSYGDTLMQDFIKRSKGFNVLRKFFGKRASYEAGYQDLALDTGKLQTWLANGDNIEAMRNAGISEDAITELRRVAYRQYGAKPDDIMIQMDKGPDPFLPGFRLHWYHMAPRPITHINMPRPAKLAGTPLQLTPPTGARPIIRGLGTGLGFTAGGFIEPLDQDEGDTTYPPPNGGR